MKKAGIAYKEPSNYFPEEIRREFKLGEFAEEETKSSRKKAQADRKAKKSAK